jgi:hypothetical protein
VLRPDFVAYIPAGKKYGFGSIFAAALPVGSHSLGWLRSTHSTQNKIEEVWFDDPNNFDERIREMVKASGGILFPRAETKIATWTGTHKDRLIFFRGLEELHVILEPCTPVDRMTEPWQKSRTPWGAQLVNLGMIAAVIGTLALIGYLIQTFR